VAYNDLMAIGFLRTLHERGVAVPREVSVIGFDDIHDAALIQPALTTIAAPLRSLGSAAVNHLLKTSIILGPRPSAVVLPARLMVRDSTGPAPGG
jgi:DNA-binding LacI/PurR family transcriptional regulator